MRTSLWDIIHPDDRDMIRSFRSRRLRDQSAPSRYVTRIVTKSGKTIWLDMRASTFELAGKQTILTTGLDITERKLWEQGISESEARLRTLMEQLADGVGLLVDGKIAFANPALARILGYTADELVGRRPTEFLAPGDRQRAMERIGALADGAPEYTAEYEMVRRDGTTVPVVINSRRIEYDGRPALLSVHRDLTEQRQLEEQLRQSQRLESVGQLAGGVAHNFNNALAAIIGYSELIARRLDEDDPVLADVRQILAVAERAASLIGELLTFSRKERISPTVFDLNEAVESSSALLGPLLGANIQLHVQLDRSLRCVLADRRQIEQVVTNLALNARDAMPDGGSLTIETSGVAVTEALARTYPDARCGSYSRLSVTDTGTGMERAIVARLFEPFFTTKEPGQGVGLGLSMVHGAVKQTGGFRDRRQPAGARDDLRVVYAGVRGVDHRVRGGGRRLHPVMNGAGRRHPVIGVMGSGVERHDTLAGAVGTWIARQGFHLLTGGGEGVMAAVSEAFATVPDRRGLAIGVLPNAEDHPRCSPPAGYPNRWVELAIRTHLPLSGDGGTAPLSRNHINVLTADVVIALPGGPGTSSEVWLAVRYARPCVAFLTDRSQIPGLPDQVRSVATLEEVAAFVLEQVERGVTAPNGF